MSEDLPNQASTSADVQCVLWKDNNPFILLLRMVHDCMIAGTGMGMGMGMIQ